MHEPSFPAPAPPSRAPQLSASRLASRVAVTLLTSPEHGSLRWPSAAAAFGLPSLEGDVQNLLSRGSRGCAFSPERRSRSARSSPKRLEAASGPQRSGPWVGAPDRRGGSRSGYGKRLLRGRPAGWSLLAGKSRGSRRA